MDHAIASESTRLVFGNIVKFIVWIIPAALFIVRVDKQNPIVSMKITTVPDRRGLWLAALISTLYFIIIFVAEKYLISGHTLASVLHTSPLLILTRLAKVFFSPISEELMFRGFVLPKFNERFLFWPANVLQALLFTALHWPNWIWVNGFQAWIAITSVGVFIIAMLLGWLAHRTNSIWPPVTVHIINNFLVSFLA